MNPLLNAFEGSKENGIAKISISEQSGVVMVEVEDDGPRLDPNQQEHLFEPFYATKPSGTGLGLAVSRNS